MPRQTFMSLSFVRTRLAVAALAIAMLLSGCQGGTTPGSPASPTGSTTATPTTSAASPLAPSVSAATSSAPAVYKPADAQGKAQNVPLPVMPELAKENSKAGLEAFIGYWYAQHELTPARPATLVDVLRLSSPELQASCLALQESGERLQLRRWSMDGWRQDLSPSH